MFLPKSSATKIIMVFSLLLFGITTRAQVIKGYVSDNQTGEPMGGATVIIKETGKKQFVQLDGNFIFKNIKPGTYEIEFRFINYKTRIEKVTVSNDKVATIEIAMEPDQLQLSNVTVVSGNSGSDRNVRALEKNSNQLVNIVSERTIALLPDITIANVLQRVSGVTIEKSGSGEARYPIIRGMEKRYINTLVNGIKIPSPDNKNRFIPLDLFPSELLERLEVSKSLTPSMEGDAIGGTINLVMKDAPVKKLLQVNFSLGYNAILGNQPYQKFDKGGINKESPAEINGKTYVASTKEFSVAHLNYSEKNTPLNTTAGITFGNRFGKDKKWGFIVSGSYQNIFRGTTSNFFLPNSQPGLGNIPLFSDLQLRNYSVHSQRIGLNGKLDYQLNKRNKISFTNTFVRLDDYQTRIVYDTVALNSLVNNKQRSTWQYQSIYNATLQGVHQLLPTLKLDWNLVYSIANNHIPDQVEFTHEYPIVATSLTADKLQSLSHLWSHNSDKDYSAYVNLTKNFQVFNKSFELKFGGLIRDKKRNNFYNLYNFNPTLGELYTNINDAVFIFSPLTPGTPNISGNNYTFDELVGAGYLQGKIQLTKKLEALGGLRIESTKQKINTDLTPDIDAKSGTIKYTDLLPSLQFKYTLAKNQNLRLAYYRALARPGFAELINDGPDGEFFNEKGNPINLEHSVADNLDLRYELFTESSDQLLLGVFYKNIQDPIEISAVKPKNENKLILQPVNIGTATNYGFEAVVTKFFGPFGVSANYTYTKSSITNDSMVVSYRNPTGSGYLTKFVSETRPLQGQSNHIGNLSLMYKNPKIGFDFQVAFVYTGKRISFISPYLGLHYWQAPTTQLDLSFEKRIVKRFTVYGKINNLTNAPYELYLDQSYNDYLNTSGSRALALQTDPNKKIIIQKDFYKTSYLIGFRYKF